MIDRVKEAADIRVEHPAHLSPRDRDRQRIQRVMRAAPRPKSVGEAEKVVLVDGVEDLDHGALQELVLQRRDAEEPQPPVRLRDLDPARRLGSVAAAMKPSVQILKPRLQVLPVGLPRHAIDPRCGLRAQRPMASRSRSTVTWCSNAVNRASVSCCATSRTRSSALDAPCPALCPARVLLAAFPSTGPLCSTASATASSAALFDSFVATTGPSDFPRSCILGLRPRPSPSGPPHHQDGQTRDLPVLAHRDSVHAQVLRPRGVHERLAITPPAILPSASMNGVGTPNHLITRLNSPACTCPCQRFADALTNANA